MYFQAELQGKGLSMKLLPPHEGANSKNEVANMQQGLEEPQEYLTQVSTPKTAYCAAAVRAWQGICHSSETGTCGCTSLKQT